MVGMEKKKKKVVTLLFFLLFFAQLKPGESSKGFNRSTLCPRGILANRFGSRQTGKRGISKLTELMKTIKDLIRFLLVSLFYLVCTF